tara:strand:+ start:41 stop:499 length:459 start_codon:yes stop_codon:yes gene_type:complete
MEKLNIKLEKLNEFPLLKYLPEKRVNCLIENGKLITLPPDELLFQEGSKQCSMFLILEGELEIFIDSILIAVRGPGEYIGEMSMIDPKIRSASVKSTQIQFTSATLIVGSRVNCGNLAVFLTDKSKRSTHEWLHTAYPRTTLPTGSTPESWP